MTETMQPAGKPFVHLHTHSYYSILAANPSPKALLNAAHEAGHTSLALTDTGAGYGLVDFYQSHKKVADAAVKPILGAEVYIAKDSRFEQRPGIDGNEGYLVLLAKNNTGYKNLLALITQAHTEGFFRIPRVDWELLNQYKDGLTVLAGGYNSIIGKAFHNQGESAAEELLAKTIETFGKENIYAEFIGRSFEKDQEVNRFMKTMMKKHGLEPVVTGDVRYITKDDTEATETLWCISRNQVLTGNAFGRAVKGSWFKTWEELTSAVSYLSPETQEQARQNTLKIGETHTVELEFGKSLLPNFTVPEGYTEATWLRKMCEDAIPVYYPDADSSYKKEIQERLDYELSIIGKMGFDAYFLIVEDFIMYAKNNGISVGPGRGSAAGSLVSYLLQITTIDPLKYGLLFERFLNPERISMPDVDIDFSDERREEVMEYVFDKYGRDKVSKVCTFGTLSAKAALKDVGRAVGVPFSEMNNLTKLLPNKPGFKLSDTKDFPDFMTMVNTNPLIKKTYDLAKKLEGCIRHVSVHACAVIIAKDPLMESCPIQFAPTSDDTKITQYPYQQLEALGLLKMDFLGLKNLTILEKTLANIKQTTGKEIDLATIPIDAKEVFEMLSKGETTGVFQFESAGMRRYLKELKPTEFEDLVAMNALYRPGPMEYIPTYIQGKHDPTSVKYMHPVLEPLLKQTYGIAVYQEQILKIAQVFAGFSLGEADILRKAIGKKIMSVLQQQRQKFINGAVEKGYEEKLAIKMFDDIIVPFSGYGFNRSHAVCYARIAYETAYLRANYPVEFMAAMMTTDRNNTDRIVIEMNECNSMNIEVLPPSLNQSGAHFTVIKDKDEDGHEVRKIRFGLTAIKGLGEESVDQMIAERNESGDFKTLGDFAKRTPVKLINKKTLEALSFSGALDEFGDRKAIVESIDELAKFAKEQHNQASVGQLGLFGAVDASVNEFTLKDFEATKEELLQWEKESLGLFVSDHPLKEYEDYIKENGTLISSLTDDDIGRTIMLHGIITETKKRMTKKGDAMAIIMIDDMSGFIELPIFPRQYAQLDKDKIAPDQIVRIEAKVNEREGSLNLIANKVTFLNKESFNTPAPAIEEKDSKKKATPKAEKKTPQTKKAPKPTPIKKPTAKEAPKPIAPETKEEVIPLFLSDSIPKANIHEIIRILKENEAADGIQLEIHLKGKKKLVPFKVNFTPEVAMSLEQLI